MVLLRTSYMYGGFLEYYFRLQFSAFWSMHDKLNYLQKKSYPPGHHLKNLEHPDKKLKSLGIS